MKNWRIDKMEMRWNVKRGWFIYECGITDINDYKGLVERLAMGKKYMHICHPLKSDINLYI